MSAVVISIFQGLLPRRATPVLYGVVAGLLAVVVQVFFQVAPPPAYGLCVACHARDVVSWLANRAAGTGWEIAPVSVSVPVLTTLGLLIGARLAAVRNSEVQRVSLGKGARSFMCGLVVVNAAIIAMGCPTRLLLLSAYGESLALLAVLGVVFGVVLGTNLLKRGMVD